MSSLISLIVVIISVSLILLSLYELKRLSTNFVCLYDFKQV